MNSIASNPGNAEKRLRIAETERNQLLVLLQEEFGEEIKAGGEIPNFIRYLATLIYRALANNSWKFKNEIPLNP